MSTVWLIRSLLVVAFTQSITTLALAGCEKQLAIAVLASTEFIPFINTICSVSNGKQSQKRDYRQGTTPFP